MVNKNLAIDFTPADEEFQRYEVSYSSFLPVKGKLFYDLPDGAYCEKFFLEAGERKKFTSYIDGYLSGRCASGLYRVEFQPVGETDAAFSFHGIRTEKAGTKEELIFLENERFRIGADLRWGGGLCCIEDKQNKSGLKNLLNRYDAGRLIQQSYYGTMRPPYQCAVYNGSRWSYNPVQGGDQYANKSKIVDYRLSPDSLYIKCQPMDWAQNKRITPSYMENTYTLTADCIRVDNRFTDFSGYEHRNSHQELPAFYVISYLDYFTFYDGAAPWTGDALTGRGNLNFWGDARYSRDCYFHVAAGNTETWCAWTAGEKGYGIGLYTPGCEILFAGRYSHNASKDPEDGATNYVAPLCTLCLESYKPLEYGYLITTGDVPAIRQTFTKYKDFRDNASFRQFKEQKDARERE